MLGWRTGVLGWTGDVRVDWGMDCGCRVHVSVDHGCKGVL